MLISRLLTCLQRFSQQIKKEKKKTTQGLHTPNVASHTCSHVCRTPTRTEKSAKLKEKPSQALLPWILIHFSTELASKYLLYFSPAAPPLPPLPAATAAREGSKYLDKR